MSAVTPSRQAKSQDEGHGFSRAVNVVRARRL